MIVYGKGVPAIADDLHISIEEAQEVKDSVLKAFPQLAEYLEWVVKFGAKHGYVENYYGVRRRLPALQLDKFTFEFSPSVEEETTKEYYTLLYTNKLKRCRFRKEKERIIEDAWRKGIQIVDNDAAIAQATRLAYNAPVQSSAATIIKIAMNNVAHNKKLQEYGVEIVLTVHDELGLCVPKKYAYEAIEIAKQEFLAAGKALPVNLKCDIEIAECWSGDSLVFDENKNLVKRT